MTGRIGRLALLLGMMLMVARCAPVDALNATVSLQSLTVSRNVSYAPDPAAAGPRRMLDIYRATTAGGPLPVAVFIYGGSWNSGSKADYLFVAQALARAGMLVFVPDYRLYPQVRFPDFVQDAAAAVAYAQRVAPSWGGDPARTFVIGHSAGAHIAALLALDHDYLARAQAASVGPALPPLAGVVGISGPYDFLPLTDPEVKAVFSATPDLTLTQPISFVDGRNPPMLLLTGTADETVQPRNTTALAERIRQAGGPVETRFYPGVGHIGTVLAFSGLFRDRAPTLADTMAFVRSH